MINQMEKYNGIHLGKKILIIFFLIIIVSCNNYDRNYSNDKIDINYTIKENLFQDTMYILDKIENQNIKILWDNGKAIRLFLFDNIDFKEIKFNCIEKLDSSISCGFDFLNGNSSKFYYSTQDLLEFFRKNMIIDFDFNNKDTIKCNFKNVPYEAITILASNSKVKNNQYEYVILPIDTNHNKINIQFLFLAEGPDENDLKFTMLKKRGKWQLSESTPKRNAKK